LPISSTRYNATAGSGASSLSAASSRTDGSTPYFGGKHRIAVKLFPPQIMITQVWLPSQKVFDHRPLRKPQAGARGHERAGLARVRLLG
jgi:hypothetical protein